MGVPISKECSGGDKVGVCWVPTSQDPMTAERSHAGIGHYADVIDKRDNYDLLVAHKVLRVIPAKDGGPPTVEFRSRDDKNAQVKRVTPKLEVVLSAGAIHTPQILQRSGIGAKAFLKKAGIDVVVDLPGVGYNFQDHCGPRFSFSLAQSFFPNQGSLTSNATFRQEAMEQYKKRPAQGPYTLAMGNSAIYIPLRNVTDHYMDIIHLITEQVESGTALDYLPSDVPDEVKKGYLAQLTLLAKSHAHPEQAILEAPWMSSAPGGGFLLKPLSRGTVMLNPEDHDAEPIVDYRTASNPVDLHVMASFLEFLRRYYATPTMKALGAVEQQPGAGVTKIEDIIESFRGGVTPSFMHPCCTAAMMPKEKGGVVGPDLKVHGVDGLRVVDLSIVPLIPGTHTSATTYAIGEKAAGMIIRKWSGGKM
jgi:choline dehydrogenase-like flavoprotein